MNILRNTAMAAVLLTAGCGLAGAHDFTATVGGQKIYLNITSESDKTVEVTYNGRISAGNVSDIQGILEIPARIKHNNEIYTVVAVGAKAFSRAAGMTGVTLPATVTSIGDFAFEGCSSLAQVVFPGGEVQWGEGVFFKCTALRNLSFGSDWKTLDLSRYRWSDSLEQIAVPARVTKIQGLKTLRHLRSVTVDVNNARFSAADGVLYSKDGKTLYACPRAYSGALRVQEGTETVTANALTDCTALTQIDFPATLRALSFRETSRMAALETVIFRGATPVITAYINKEGRFLLQTANPELKIVVPKEARKAYLGVMADVEGEYTESTADGKTPYVVTTAQMPQEKNLTGVKNFSKYE